MPYYETSQEWLRQSAMLLEARGSSTRITTTYHLTDKSGTSKKRQKRRQEQREAANPNSTTTPTSAAPRASLTIKTYDPHTGTCLKYRTTKAAEVSRLILCLGQLGRKMAALPSSSTDDVDTVMADLGGAGVDDVGGATPAAAAGVEKTEGSGPAKGQQQTQQQQQGGGGKNKKKKGKK